MGAAARAGAGCGDGQRMSELGQLALPDVEAALRLVTGTDPHPRDPEPLLAGLARLAGADAWAWVLQRLESEILETSYYAMLDGGWQDERQRVSWIDSSLSPEVRTLLETMASHLDRHATFTRSQLIDDSQWYASAFYLKYREPVGLDDLLWSFVPVAPGVQSALRLHRFAGSPPFGSRERDLVHVVMSAVDWLHRSELPGGARALLVGLSRREREVPGAAARRTQQEADRRAPAHQRAHGPRLREGDPPPLRGPQPRGALRPLPSPHSAVPGSRCKPLCDPIADPRGHRRRTRGDGCAEQRLTRERGSAQPLV
jgi:hypothetical protein